MIPPIATTPISLYSSAPSPSATIAPRNLGTFSTVALSNWRDRDPVTSPDLHAAPAPRLIAQSELPGGSTPVTPPVTPPPSPSIRDTGDGYPTRIPSNYFGPAIGFGNSGNGFGIISRFPLGTNYSVRPSAVFGGNGTVLRVPVTYDFALGDKEPFERNPLVTFHAGGGVQYASGTNGSNSSKFAVLGTIGVDVNLFEGVALLGSFNTDFNSNNGTNVGLGFEF